MIKVIVVLVFKAHHDSPQCIFPNITSKYSIKINKSCQKYIWCILALCFCPMGNVTGCQTTSSIPSICPHGISCFYRALTMVAYLGSMFFLFLTTRTLMLPNTEFYSFKNMSLSFGKEVRFLQSGLSWKLLLFVFLTETQTGLGDLCFFSFSFKQTL